MEHPFLSENWGTKNTRLEFNLKTGKYKQEVFPPDIAIEFPQVNWNYIGYKSKYIYLPYVDKVLPTTQAAKDNMSVSGFFKFDTDLKKVLGKIDFGPIKRGGEVFF
jgi:carotenoid cleavage dioxygenase-like enzyme